jgi:two-component system sensor histidine kinase/response regulator
VTASAFGADSVECLQAGMNDHIAKPIVPAQLYATLLRWLSPHGSSASASMSPLSHHELRGADLDGLDGMLQAGDFAAEAAYRAIRPAMQAHLGEGVSEFEAALAAYDHDRARLVLQRLRSGSPEFAMRVCAHPVVG